MVFGPRVGVCTGSTSVAGARDPGKAAGARDRRTAGTFFSLRGQGMKHESEPQTPQRLAARRPPCCRALSGPRTPGLRVSFSSAAAACR